MHLLDALLLVVASVSFLSLCTHYTPRASLPLTVSACGVVGALSLTGFTPTVPASPYRRCSCCLWPHASWPSYACRCSLQSLCCPDAAGCGGGARWARERRDCFIGAGVDCSYCLNLCNARIGDRAVRGSTLTDAIQTGSRSHQAKRGCVPGGGALLWLSREPQTNTVVQRRQELCVPWSTML